MRVAAVLLALVGSLVGPLVESAAADPTDGLPLEPAGPLGFDAPVMVTVVTPDGESSPSICPLGPIIRLGQASANLLLPKRWLWIAEMNRGYVPAAAKAPGISIFSAPKLDVDAIGKLTHLRYLAVQRSPLTDLSRWAKLTRLWGLNVANNGALMDIAALVQYPDLRTLDLSGCMQLPRSELDVIAKLKNLRWLGVENSRADDSLIAKLPTGLEAIRLRGTAVTNRGLGALAKRCGNLRRVELASCPVSDQGIAALKSLKKLETLDLSMTQVSWKSLKTITRFGDLRSLTLDSVRLPDKHVRRWKGNPKLEKLVVTGSGIGSSGLEAISKRVALRELHVDSIDEDGLSAIGGMGDLLRLYIRNSPTLSDQALADALTHLTKLKTAGLARLPQLGALALAQLGNCTQLEWLDLTGCPKVTDQAVATLKKRVPRLKVVIRR